MFYQEGGVQNNASERMLSIYSTNAAQSIPLSLAEKTPVCVCKLAASVEDVAFLDPNFLKKAKARRCVD